MAKPLYPNDGKPIGRDKVERMLNKYNEHHPDKDEVKAEFFGRDVIEEILKQKDCVGIRIYYAYTENAEPGRLKLDKRLLLVGAREDGSNIWSIGSAGKDGAEGGGIVADDGKPCPPTCPDGNG